MISTGRVGSHAAWATDRWAAASTTAVPSVPEFKYFIIVTPPFMALIVTYGPADIWNQHDGETRRLGMDSRTGASETGAGLFARKLYIPLTKKKHGLV